MLKLPSNLLAYTGTHVQEGSHVNAYCYARYGIIRRSSIGSTTLPKLSNRRDTPVYKLPFWIYSK